MADYSPTKAPRKVEEGIKEMKIENGDSDEEVLGTITVGERKRESTSRNDTGSPIKVDVRSPIGLLDQLDSPLLSSEMPDEHDEEILGGEITVKMEPGHPPKLQRSSTQKVPARTPPLFSHLPDRTAEATNMFQVIADCTYSNKNLGYTEHAMECDCSEEWDATTKTNHACCEDSDCINRATKMECFGDCGCGSDCQNQRFQQRQYANVSVIQTEKKGYGLRTESNLLPNDFIFEYIGEVIHEGQFRKRMIQYDDEGIKHFYFMSLSKGEFVDATKRGNLGRFCNHSCNPNCYVDKWVVGDKLRMGIFAERKIEAGEELVFNYNVDRYGADPQPCYCGEPNCTGFIGGKTQTERATKLSHATIEALGIDDGDGWDTAVARRPRKKKTGEDDEEYVNNVQPKSLDEDGVTKVMATLMQCKEKWIAVKLLGRIQRADDERVISRVVKMHGYQILNSALSTWKEDFNVVLQILDILNHFPRLTKNKISDSKIEGTVSSLESCGDERVESQAKALLHEWSTLETAYRIPRKKRDPNAGYETASHFDRRGDERRRRSRSSSQSRSRSRSIDAPRGPSAPTGPRSNFPRGSNFYHANRQPFRPQRNLSVLPVGWFAASHNGHTYYYSASGEVTWQKPTAPAQPPPPPKPTSNSKILDDIINEITSAKSKSIDKSSASATPIGTIDDSKPQEKDGKEKWRSYSEEKQQKVYEHTLFPHVKHVVDKYKHKLPKDDIKRFFKEVLKKLVNSDFKNNRVTDPTKVTEKQEKNVKKYVKDYFDKAVAKKKEHDKKKAEKKAKENPHTPSPETLKTDQEIKRAESDIDETMEVSDDEGVKKDRMSITPITPLDQMAHVDGLKRKRVAEVSDDGIKAEEEEATPSKRARSFTPPEPPPPPPPPLSAEDHMMLDNRYPLEDWPNSENVTVSGEEGDRVEPRSPLLPHLEGSETVLEASFRKETTLDRNKEAGILIANMIQSNHEDDGSPPEKGFMDMNGISSSYMQA